MIPGNTDVTLTDVIPTSATATSVTPVGVTPVGVTQAALHLPDRCRAVGGVLSRVGDKWSVLVVMQLSGGPKRFSALKRSIGSVSQRMLTLTLRGLERDGLVLRTVTPAVPPRVDYELTELGHSLRQPVEALGGWAMENYRQIEAAQKAFDGMREEGAG